MIDLVSCPNGHRHSTSSQTWHAEQSAYNELYRARYIWLGALASRYAEFFSPQGVGGRVPTLGVQSAANALRVVDGHTGANASVPTGHYLYSRKRS